MVESVDKSKQEVWQIVNSIPVGKVATYGQIARLAGMPKHARMVGRILRNLPKGTKLPWHRVINSQGKLSGPSSPIQIERLAEEGVALINGKIRLKLYGWEL